MMTYDRRQFIERASVLAGTALMPLWGQSVRAQPRFGGTPFTLGVASGDPLPDGVVIWTRLAPRPLDPDGGMPAEAIDVRWEVAEDAGFRTIARTGRARAFPQAAHTVHVEVDGLRPDRPYHYRFFVGQEESPHGRTRTTPLAGADVQALRYAFTGCQRYDANFYAPYRQMVEDDPAMVLFLGDYIYESAAKELIRPYPTTAARDLTSYRQRHAIYKGDPALQAAHAAAPWMVIWDDHEVQNNYGGDFNAKGRASPQFLLRRAAAYQAYYEHMPLRRRSVPVGPAMQLYRSLDWGRLARFNFLDLRQYRGEAPCADMAAQDNVVADCPSRLDPARSIMGAEQEKWLFASLAKSPARWNVLAQQYLMAEVRHADPDTGKVRYSTDGWDAAPASRQRLIDLWRDAKVSNPFAIGSDTHAFVASELRSSFDGPAVASAFVGGSLASPYNDTGKMARIRAANPHIRFGDGTRRGYALVDVTPQRNHIAYRAAVDSKDANSATTTLTNFVVENGRPGFSID